MRFALIFLLLPGMAHALKCKPSARVLQPGEQVATNGFLVASGAMWSVADALKTAHFVDAAGKTIPLTLEPHGQQVVVRATAPLSGTVKLVGLPPRSLLKAPPLTVDAAPKAPRWTGAVTLVDHTVRQMGRYGKTWNMQFSAPAVGTRLVQLSVKSPEGVPITRYLPIQEGKVRMGDWACSGMFRGALPPGKHAAELRLVALDGTVSAPKPITLDVVDRRP